MAIAPVPRLSSPARSHPPIRAYRAYLAQFTDYERQVKVAYRPTTYNLRRMRALCRALGDPQERFRSLHITGTKGKGSTAAMVAAALRAHGLRVGLYTSPHLVALEERIQIDGRPIPRADFARLLGRLVPCLEDLHPPGGMATFFEITTALAFLYFAEQKVDFAVVEVGLGGRLDATNVLRPVATAITCIDFDHMDKLGHTLAAIAREKAGIAKRGVPLVTAERAAEPLRAIERACARRGAPLLRAGPGGDLELVRFRPVWRGARPGIAAEVRGLGRTWRRLFVPLAGSHQARNLVVALGLIELLAARRLLRLRPAAVRAGLARTRARGRVEVIHPRPWPGGPGLIVDVAHNPVSLQGTLGVLEFYPRLTARGRVLVLAFSRDKEIDRMLFVARDAQAVVCTGFPSPRALPPAELAARLAATGWHWPRGLHVAATPARALARARARARPREWILATGSFYLAGELLGRLDAAKRRRPAARR
ncbi:MAG: bifunctional folylpolyglutamate synthase/dihydrofolate synthase [Planctomycetes bacterium]|nr:bifunctional folylpolyglutamate synthase/dihydrofolate synthase [Planctomycetota bacterium]